MCEEQMKSHGGSLVSRYILTWKYLEGDVGSGYPKTLVIYIIVNQADITASDHSRGYQNSLYFSLLIMTPDIFDGGAFLKIMTMRLPFLP